MVRRIEARQESLRDILIYLILVLFGVGILLIVGAYAIYKGWCCNYDLQAKTQTNFCLKLCCKGGQGESRAAGNTSSSRRNSPQEILQMSDLRGRDDVIRDQSEAEGSEDEADHCEDDHDDRHHSNRRRTRGSRSRRGQGQSQGAGEVTQIYIIDGTGFSEPPPTYEESNRVHGNTGLGQGQGQSEGHAQGDSSSRGSSESVILSSRSPAAHVGGSRPDVPPTYEQSQLDPAHPPPPPTGGITISPAQLSRLAQGGSIPARARMFVLRSEARSQTVASSRLMPHSRPGIPGSLVGLGGDLGGGGREYVTTARTSRSSPRSRRDRRSPHRTRRRSPIPPSEDTHSTRSNRSTPRSTRSTPRSNRSNRSCNRDSDSPRRSDDRTPPSTSSRSRGRSHSRDDNQRGQSSRSQRSPSAHSTRSLPNVYSEHGGGGGGRGLQVFNRRGSDSSTDLDIDRPPRDTPRATTRGTPRETPRESRRNTPRGTPRETPRESRRNTPRGTPRETPRESRRNTPSGTAPAPSSSATDSHESFIATSEYKPTTTAGARGNQ